jgi:hypothetical protein
MNKEDIKDYGRKAKENLVDNQTTLKNITRNLSILFAASLLLETTGLFRASDFLNLKIFFYSTAALTLLYYALTTRSETDTTFNHVDKVFGATLITETLLILNLISMPPLNRF